MYKIIETAEFSRWLRRVDGAVRARLIKRLRKVGLGTLGDVEPVGEGVSEMREHFGSGWRMYYIQRGSVIIMMLGGGTKATQSADIKAAKKQAQNLGD